MNDRRRALLAGESKGLYIYKAGFTDWQNVAEVTTSVSPTISFGTNKVTVTASSKNTGSEVNLRILEEVYGKVSKLVFTIAGTGTRPRVHWGEDIEVSLTSAATEYFIDISQSSGERLVTLDLYTKSSVFTVYDIHFE